MKIAVIGLYYATNLGDAVICDCVAKWLCDEYPQAQIDVIDITGSTRFEEEQPVSLRILRKRQKNLRKDYWLTRHGFSDKVYYWSSQNVKNRECFYEQTANKRYDMAVFAGGQLFMDWLSLYICEFVKAFAKVGTPVYFNACGVGISVSNKIKEELKNCMNMDNVRFISSRDDVATISTRYLEKDKTAVWTYDPALWTKETYGVSIKQEAEHGKCSADSGVIGLGVMHCSQIPAKKLIRFWCKVIKELERRRIPWKLFCNGAMDDYQLGCHILEKLHLNKEKYLCLCAKRPKQLAAQIAGFRGLISFRLHSHIIAASYEIPAVAILWDDKLRFFYQHLNHPERCMTVGASAKEVVDRLEYAIEEGYDAFLIEKQKKYAKDLLVKQLPLIKL